MRAARHRDSAIRALASKVVPTMRIHEIMGHNLVDPSSIVSAHGGKPVTTHAAWLTASIRCGGAPRPVPVVSRLPPPGAVATRTGVKNASYPIALVGCNRNGHIMNHDQFTAFGRLLCPSRGRRVGACLCRRCLFSSSSLADRAAMLADSLAGPRNDFAIPTMDELGLPPATTHIRGGETEGRRRMAEWLSDEEQVVTFSKPKSSSTSLEPSTSLLSPYFKFGCVSVRELYWRTQDIITAWSPAQAATLKPANMLGQVSCDALWQTCPTIIH